MSIRVTQSDEMADLIQVAFDGQWSWDDFFAMQDEVDAIISENDREMDILIDFSGSAHFPSGFAGNAGKMSDTLNPRARRLVFVNIGGAPRVILEMYKKLFPRDGSRYFPVGSLEEARDLLAQPYAR